MKDLIIVATLIGVVLAYNTFLKPDKWDLMICETVMANGVECYDNAEVLKGYESQRQCMEAGIRLASDRGYECGKNCDSDELPGLMVCEEVCNNAGCH